MPEQDLYFWVAAVIAATLVGMSKGGLPAVGMLAVPVMALVMNPILAAGLLLPVYMVSDVFGVWAYRRAYDRRVLAILVPPAIAGVAIGWATASLAPERLVIGVIGAIGLAFSLNLMLRRPPVGPPKVARIVTGWFWGALTGFTSYVSHAGGPPYQVYVLPLGLSKTTFAGTTTVTFAIINAAKLLPYWQLGLLSTGNLRVASMLLLPAVAAVFLGVGMVRVMPERPFFRFVTVTLLVISLKLLWDAAFG